MIKKKININDTPIQVNKNNKYLSYCKKFCIYIYDNYGSIIICFIVISWFLYYRYKLNINLKHEKKNKIKLYNSLTSKLENFEDKSDMVYVTPNIDFNNNSINIDDQVNILEDSDTDIFENYNDNDDDDNNHDIQNLNFYENFINSNTYNPVPSNSDDPTFNYL